MPTRLVVFYFYTRNATFIQKDLAILRTRFQVMECAFPAPEKWKTPLLFAVQVLFLLRHIGLWSRAVAVAQFAGYHTFIPTLWARVFGRKSILVVGGTDCVSFPSLRYGHFQNKLLAWFTRQSYRWADVVSAVHSSLFYREDHYYLPEESRQGILHFVPEARFEQHVVFNGFDIDLFSIRTPFSHRKPLSFITISVSLDDPIRMKLKGIDMVLELARHMPNATFTLIGASSSHAISIPPNVTLVPYVPNSELPIWYNQHQYYVQLSVSEGFPNALCEAMACGCVPVVSAVASMPEIVHGNGAIIPKRNLADVQAGVNALIARPDAGQLSIQASQSVADRFSMEKRKEKLIWLILQKGATLNM